jgi:hypothetical protein
MGWNVVDDALTLRLWRGRSAGRAGPAVPGSGRRKYYNKNKYLFKTWIAKNRLPGWPPDDAVK